MTPSSIAAILQQCRTIAVVGLSPKAWRDSYEVAQYLQKHGYKIIPVNPGYAGQSILGEICYATLTDADQTLAQQGVKIDMVDCFRKSEDIPPIAEQAIAIQARVLWMQLGISHDPAAAAASAAGLQVVMNRCTKIDHRNLIANH